MLRVGLIVAGLVGAFAVASVAVPPSAQAQTFDYYHGSETNNLL